MNCYNLVTKVPVLWQELNKSRKVYISLFEISEITSYTNVDYKYTNQKELHDDYGKKRLTNTIYV